MLSAWNPSDSRGLATDRWLKYCTQALIIAPTLGFSSAHTHSYTTSTALDSLDWMLRKIFETRHQSDYGLGKGPAETKYYHLFSSQWPPVPVLRWSPSIMDAKILATPPHHTTHRTTTHRCPGKVDDLSTSSNPPPHKQVIFSAEIPHKNLHGAKSTPAPNSPEQS